MMPMQYTSLRSRVSANNAPRFCLKTDLSRGPESGCSADPKKLENTFLFDYAYRFIPLSFFLSSSIKKLNPTSKL